MDSIIEYPKRNGEAKGASVRIELKIYPVWVEGGRVLNGLDG